MCFATAALSSAIASDDTARSAVRAAVRAAFFDAAPATAVAIESALGDAKFVLDVAAQFNDRRDDTVLD